LIQFFSCVPFTEIQGTILKLIWNQDQKLGFSYFFILFAVDCLKKQQIMVFCMRLLDAISSSWFDFRAWFVVLKDADQVCAERVASIDSVNFAS